MKCSQLILGQRKDEHADSGTTCQKLIRSLAPTLISKLQQRNSRKAASGAKQLCEAELSWRGCDSPQSNPPQAAARNRSGNLTRKHSTWLSDTARNVISEITSPQVCAHASNKRRSISVDFLQGSVSICEPRASQLRSDAYHWWHSCRNIPNSR